MNKRDARKIAETITNEQLQKMLNTAKTKIADWTKISNVNKGMTKGTAWNILGSGFDVNASHHILAKTNMIREFGEFLPNELRAQKKARHTRQPVHQWPELDY